MNFISLFKSVPTVKNKIYLTKMFFLKEVINFILNKVNQLNNLINLYYIDQIFRHKLFKNLLEVKKYHI